MLTSLANHVAQKALVKEMWDSGAHTIVSQPEIQALNGIENIIQDSHRPRHERWF